MTNVIWICESIIIISALLMIACIIRNRDILVKLVALEIVTNLLMGGIALWALQARIPIILDSCVGLALIMFVAIVAYCYHLGSESLNDY